MAPTIASYISPPAHSRGSNICANIVFTVVSRRARARRGPRVPDERHHSPPCRLRPQCCGTAPTHMSRQATLRRRASWNFQELLSQTIASDYPPFHEIRTRLSMSILCRSPCSSVAPGLRPADWKVSPRGRDSTRCRSVNAVGKALCASGFVDATERAARRALRENRGASIRSPVTNTTARSRCVRRTGACRQPNNGPGGSVAVQVGGHNANRASAPAVNDVRHTLEVLASRYRSRLRS